MTQALAITSGKTEKAEQIKDWFDKFQGMLQQIFEDDSVKLEFDEDTFKFQIVMDNREPFDFNTLSSGYAAILDIVVDLIIRMEKQTNKVFDFSIPGVVLIDEIESHLQEEHYGAFDHYFSKCTIHCVDTFAVCPEQSWRCYDL